MYINNPVLMLLYNRPYLTKGLFQKLEEIGRFKELYIAIDGPKETKVDKDKVNSVHEICHSISFADKVYYRVNPRNLGCKKAVQSAIDWFFDHVTEGLILEDDCYPEPQFFEFTESMLERYRNDTRVAQVCGYNTAGYFECSTPYFYSTFGSIWGWATWRRAWKCYDPDMKTFTEDFYTYKAILKRTGHLFDGIFRIKNFLDTKKDKIDTWDYQWIYSRLSQNMLSVVPNISLVENVGFGEDGTHTFTREIKHKTTSSSDMLLKQDWAHPAKPLIMMPNYSYEKEVAALKRGLWGLGPIRTTLKLCRRFYSNILR